MWGYEQILKEDIMAIPEACGLWIEQRVQEEMEERKETGNSIREIGRKVAAEVEKYFETKVSPDTIRKRAERQGGTNVPKGGRLTATTDTEEIKEIKPAKDGTRRGGSRPGAGRKRAQKPDDAIMGKLKEINRAIESGDISNKALEATRKSLNKRDHDPQARQEFVEQQPKKSRLRLLDDWLGDVIDELRHFADGTIEHEDGDHVWVKAIGMKGPVFICQFHKLGIDLNQVYSTLINPGKNLDHVADDTQAEATGVEPDQVDAATDNPDPAADVQEIQATDNDTVQGDDLEDIELDTAHVNSDPEQDQPGDGDTALGDQEPEIDDAAAANQIEPDTQGNQEPDLTQSSDDVVTDDSVQATAQADPAPDAQAHVDVVEPAQEIQADDNFPDAGGPQADAGKVHAMIDETAAVDLEALVPDCRDRKITIEEKDQIILALYAELPGPKNAQARVDLVNKKGVPAKVDPLSQYGGEFKVSTFKNAVIGAKKREAKRQAAQLPQD
jgi:hypothetical protein